MAIIINKTAFLDAPISVESLHGVVFSNENKGHKFVITGIRGGELQTFTGSVIARFIRANNTTILMGEGAEGELAACATIEDGKVSVSLARDCYNVPGRFQLTVFVTNEGETSCVYAAVGTVQRSENGTLIDDGVALPSVDELQSMLDEIQQYETDIATAGATQIAAVQAKGEETLDSIPDDYTALQGEVDDLKSALVLDNVSTPGIWELGNIGMSSGNNTSANPNTRMRTIGFLGDNIASINKISGNYILYAYEGDTYIGHWNGTGFDTTTSAVTLTNVDLSAIKSTYPTYKYRLVWYLSGSYTPDPSTDYANIILYNALYNELNNMQEQIDDVADDINEVIENQDRINNENFIGNLSNADLWESGQIGTVGGNNGTSASRMRTKGYISDYTYQISTSSGYFILFAYDPTAETPYVGVWTGNGFEKTTTYSSLTSFVLASIKSTYPTYKYRLVWYLSGSYTPDPTEDYANIVIANEKTAIAYGVTLNGAKIVNMGDSIFGLHFAPVDISTFISQATGATCYNCAFPGTRAVTRSENIGKKKFDLTTLVDAIISGDYSEQDAVREAATGSTDYDHLPTLESVDFSTVDIITLSYGTNDYGGDVVIGAAGNGNASTFIGAMQEAIGKLETAFPQARIFVCTPIYRSWHNESTYENADTRQNANGDTLLDFVEAVGTISKAEYVPEIDNHYIGINAATRTVYTTDGTHPNESGRRLIARHMAKKLF